MSKRFSLLATIIVLGLGTAGCVAPYYGTARIEPGWDFNAGIAYSKGGFTFWPYSSTPRGIRLDGYAGYGFNPYVKPYLRSSIGSYYSVSYPFPTEENGDTTTGYDRCGDIGAGVQAALPLGFVTPALNVEVSPFLFGEVSTALLLGLGKREILTLGVRPHFVLAAIGDGFIPTDVFVSVHPFKGLSLFAGAIVNGLGDRIRNDDWDDWWFTIGAGYGFNVNKEKRFAKRKVGLTELLRMRRLL